MTKRAYAIIAASFLTISIAYSTRYAYGLLLPEMLPALGISMTQAGIIYAAHFTLYTVSTPIVGAVADRLNNRIMLAVFSAVFSWDLAVWEWPT